MTFAQWLQVAVVIAAASRARDDVVHLLRWRWAVLTERVRLNELLPLLLPGVAIPALRGAASSVVVFPGLNDRLRWALVLRAPPAGGECRAA